MEEDWRQLSSSYLWYRWIQPWVHVCGYGLIADHWSTHNTIASLLHRHSADRCRHQAVQSSAMSRLIAPQTVAGPPLLRLCSRRRWADDLSTMPASQSIAELVVTTKRHRVPEDAAPNRRFSGGGAFTKQRRRDWAHNHDGGRGGSSQTAAPAVCLPLPFLGR
jgi:hypothetical protein